MKQKVHLVFASLFTDRAISYRHDRGKIVSQGETECIILHKQLLTLLVYPKIRVPRNMNRMNTYYYYYHLAFIFLDC